MRHFEAVRSHLGSRHTLRHNDPYLISFDLTVASGRHQGIYLAELEDESDRRFLRISTPVGPLSGIDAQRALRFNWEQRTGFLAVTDLDGSQPEASRFFAEVYFGDRKDADVGDYR